MASRGEVYWQEGLSLAQRNQYMLDNQLACDVTFRVMTSSMTSSVTSASVEEVGAHKFALMAASPVFEAMLCGPLAAQQERDDDDNIIIDLNDADGDTLRAFLAYIYYEKFPPPPEEALPLLYLAHKYLVAPLANASTRHLEAELNPGNCLCILSAALLYSEQTLAERCLSVAAEHGAELLESEDWMCVSKAALKRIIQMDSLTVPSEVHVLEACIRWARWQHRQAALPGDSNGSENDEKVNDAATSGEGGVASSGKQSWHQSGKSAKDKDNKSSEKHDLASEKAACNPDDKSSATDDKSNQTDLNNPAGACLRELLGDCIYDIRFPVMSVSEFDAAVQRCDLLTADETLKLYHCVISGTRQEAEPFNGYQRHGRAPATPARGLPAAAAYHNQYWARKARKKKTPRARPASAKMESSEDS